MAVCMHAFRCARALFGAWTMIILSCICLCFFVRVYFSGVEDDFKLCQMDWRTIYTTIIMYYIQLYRAEYWRGR